MKSINFVIFILISIVSVCLLVFKLDYNNAKAFEYIITFLSIAVGFNITALSIIANSAFSGRLYNIEDSKDNSRTLLHVLVSEFRTAIGVFLATIMIILAFYFIEGLDNENKYLLTTIRGHQITIAKLLKSTIWYLTIVSSIKFCKLLITFSKVVIKSAPRT